MIYIFDNITNREKSIFSNVLKNVSEAPVIYFNYYTPFKDIIDHKLNTDVTSITHGFSSLKGDYFMNNTDLNEVSFNDEFRVNIQPKIDEYKEDLIEIINNKIKKFEQNLPIIIDGIYNEELIKKIITKNTKDKIVIVSGSLKKDHNIFEKIEGDYQKFTIEIDESSTSKKIEGELKKVIKKEDQVIKIEMLQPSTAA